MGKKSKRQSGDNSSQDLGHVVTDNANTDQQSEEVSVFSIKRHKKSKKAVEGESPSHDSVQELEMEKKSKKKEKRKAGKENESAEEEPSAQKKLKLSSELSPILVPENDTPPMKKHKKSKRKSEVVAEDSRNGLVGDLQEVLTHGSKAESGQKESNEMNESVEKVDEIQDSAGETKLKKKDKKKKKKDTDTTNPEHLTTSQCEDSVKLVVPEHIGKKDKKGCMHAAERNAVMSEDPTESVSKKKSKKKKKGKESDTNSLIKSPTSVSEDSTEITSEKSKKKKKKSKHCAEGDLVEQTNCDNSAEMLPHKGKKKAKESTAPAEPPQETPSETISEKVSKKQKKRKTPSPPEYISGCDHSTETVAEKKSKKRKSREDTDLAVQTSTENATEIVSEKKKKKKKNSIGIVPSEETTSVNDHAAEISEKKIKKRKKAENTPEMDTAESGIQDETSKRKQKKKKSKEEGDTPERNLADVNAAADNSCDDKEKKKKRKSKEKGHAPEQNCVDGNTNGSTVADSKNADNDNSELKRKDQTSDTQTENNVKKTDDDNSTTVSQTTPMGQWSTNMFSNSDRQNKFLRLLGGLKKGQEGAPAQQGLAKKGLFGSLTLSQQPGPGGQRALTHQAAREMNCRLETDYERALTFSARGQRGVGLGFKPDPAEGKKFRININKVASKTFD